MIFHENRLLADDSHEISYLIFFKNSERCRKICCLLQLWLELKGFPDNEECSGSVVECLTPD